MNKLREWLFRLALLLQTIWRKNGPELYNVLLAQARLESGNFTSRIWKDGRNPWGMKVATVRPSAQSGSLDSSTGPYAKYGSMWSAVRDRMLWDKYNDMARFYGDPVMYMTEVKRAGYAEDPMYVDSWYDVFRKLKTLEVYVFAVAFLGLSGLLVYAIVRLTGRRAGKMKLGGWFRRNKV